jgi:hypothetical protein
MDTIKCTDAICVAESKCRYIIEVRTAGLQLSFLESPFQKKVQKQKAMKEVVIDKSATPSSNILDKFARRVFQESSDEDKPLGRWGYHYDRVKIHQVYYE